MLEERALIERARAGDGRAFEGLVTLHAPLVYNLALRLLHDRHDAEDLAQEAFVRVWQGLPGFRAEAQFSTWLYRIVTNLCYNRMPRLRQDLLQMDPEIAVDWADELQDVEDTVLGAETTRRLYRAVDELPEGHRLLLTLRHLQDMSYAEIAEATGLPLGTVKTGIHRARHTLRRTLVQEGMHGPT